MARVSQKFDFDRRFQAKLVRALYQFPDESRDILEHIEPSMFDSKPMEWTVSKMKRVLKVTHAPATMTVLEYEAQRDVKYGMIKGAHLGAFADFLSKLDKPVPEKTYLIDRAHEYIKHTSLRRLVVDIAKKMQSKQRLDWDEVNRQLDEQRRYGDAVGDTSLGQDYFADTEARFERRKSFEKLGIPTGIDWIDENMRHGGLPPKQLGVVLMPPGRGKTASLVYMSGSAVTKYGKSSLYISLELDEDIIGERHDARFSGIEIGDLTRIPKRAKRRVLRAAGKGGKLYIKEFPAGSLSIGGLRAFMRRLESVSFYPDVIFIDYADNMNLNEFGGGSSESDYSPLGRLYIALRGLASEFHVPIWTASQGNRGSVEKPEMGIQDLADSFKKAAVADFIFSASPVFRKPNSKTDKAPYPMSVRTKFSILKNRNGSAGKSKDMKFDTARVIIKARS